MMRPITTVMTTLVLAALVLATPSVGAADKGGSQITRISLRAKLVPCCGNPEPEAHGQTKRNAVGRNGAPQTDRVSANIELPAPSAGLGITDPTAADVRLVLTRSAAAGGADYAECAMQIDGHDNADEGDDEANGEAEFKLHVQVTVRKGSPVLKPVKGQCDVDLLTADVQPGIPDVQAGDVATVVVVDPDTAARTPFLQGTFSTRSGH